jgi:hypothetical protein
MSLLYLGQNEENSERFFIEMRSGLNVVQESFEDAENYELHSEFEEYISLEQFL